MASRKAIIATRGSVARPVGAEEALLIVDLLELVNFLYQGFRSSADSGPDMYFSFSPLSSINFCCVCVSCVPSFLILSDLLPLCDGRKGVAGNGLSFSSSRKCLISSSSNPSSLKTLLRSFFSVLIVHNLKLGTRSLSLRRSEVFRLEKLGRRGEGGEREFFGVEVLDDEDEREGIVTDGLLLLLVFE